MSVEAASPTVAPQTVWHQFEDIEQQNESYVVGMWTFLVTEIMFFGALFLAYVLYRAAYPDVFYDAHKHLNVKMGAANTMILLTSSLTMALAVRCAQIGNKRWKINWMCVTILFAFGFLVIKYFEYTEKFEHHLFPGPTFKYSSHEHPGEAAHAAPVEIGVLGEGRKSLVPTGELGKDTRDKAQMFFSLYFVMTGLHGIHVIVGIIIMGAMIFGFKINYPSPSLHDYIPTEMTGLYWHFVDIVWIFLFPLYYLIPK